MVNSLDIVSNFLCKERKNLLIMRHPPFYLSVEKNTIMAFENVKRMKKLFLSFPTFLLLQNDSDKEFVEQIKDETGSAIYVIEDLSEI